MSRIESKLIIGTTASDEANDRVKALGNIEVEHIPQYHVFEARVDGKTYYCCWSGGKVENGEVMLTDVGLAAFEALGNLPLNDKAAKTLIFQQLHIGKIPLQEKVIAAFKRAPEGASICFFGDLAKELDGHMHPAFNVIDCVMTQELAFAKTAH